MFEDEATPYTQHGFSEGPSFVFRGDPPSSRDVAIATSPEIDEDLEMLLETNLFDADWSSPSTLQLARDCPSPTRTDADPSELERTPCRRQMWSLKDDKLLSAAALEFRPDHGSRWKQIAKRVLGKTTKQCRERWINHLAPTINKTAWSPHEDAVLRTLVLVHGPLWSKIARLMAENRTDMAVKNRYLCLNRIHGWPELAQTPSRQRRQQQLQHRRHTWSLKDDKLLSAATLEFRPDHGSRWKQIAKRVLGKTTKQCRERWINHLAPTINKTAWSPHEDAVLRTLVLVHGPQWSKIACLMAENRTDMAIKNRYLDLDRIHGWSELAQTPSRQQRRQSKRLAVPGEGGALPRTSCQRVCRPKPIPAIIEQTLQPLHLPLPPPRAPSVPASTWSAKPFPITAVLGIGDGYSLHVQLAHINARLGPRGLVR